MSRTQSSSPAPPASSAATCSTCSSTRRSTIVGWQRARATRAAWSPTAARARGGRRDARSRGGRRRGGREIAARRSSITWPASRTSATRGSTPARRSRATSSAPHHLLRGAARRRLARACSSPARRSSTSRIDRAITETRRDRRRTARTAPASSRRRCWRSGPGKMTGCRCCHAGVQSHRPAAGSVVLGAAASRGRSRGSKPAAMPPVLRWATSTPQARPHRRARHGAGVPGDDGAARPGMPYNVCAGQPVADSRRCSTCSAHGARLPITVEQDRRHFRPHDMPLVARRPSQLTADTGWAPQIPLPTDRRRPWLTCWSLAQVVDAGVAAG